MKYFVGTNIMDFSWEQVAVAFWQRYPNPQSSHVLSEDTLQRRIVKPNQLHSLRVISKTNSMPKWGERFMPGQKQMLVVEESVVDRKKQTLTTYTRNICMQSILSIQEKCVYSQSPDDKSQTICKREAWVNSSLYGLSRVLQSFGLDRFKRNSVKALAGYNHVLNSMYSPDMIPINNVAMSKLNKLTEAAKLNKEKLKHTAQKARDIATAKGVTVAACENIQDGKE